MLPQLVWYQVILRAGVAAALFSEILVLVTLPSCIYLFACRPYLPEVILLERNPLRSRRPGQTTTGSRARMLHRGHTSDLFVRWMGSMWWSTR